jgi:hypothetical protein
MGSSKMSQLLKSANKSRKLIPSNSKLLFTLCLLKKIKVQKAKIVYD